MNKFDLDAFTSEVTLDMANASLGHSSRDVLRTALERAYQSGRWTGACDMLKVHPGDGRLTEDSRARLAAATFGDEVEITYRVTIPTAMPDDASRTRSR
jgi:hypothetical protein